MDDGGLNANTAATLALLADTSRAGGRGGVYGGGYGEGGMGGGYLASAAIADGTAVKTAIDCGINQFEAGLGRVSDQAEESRRSAQFTTLVDQSNTNSTRIADNQFQAELRNGDRLRDIEREIARNASIAAACCCDTQKAIADAAKEAAACCCDAKLEACKNTNEIMQAIAAQGAVTLAVESRGIERDRNTLQAELISLRTQVNCGCNSPS